MICKKCGKEIKFSDLSSKKWLCKKCYNKYYKEYKKNNYKKTKEYNREYARTIRWLNGGPDNFLLGENIPYEIFSKNGNLFIK